jgi:hypothetical protein
LHLIPVSSLRLDNLAFVLHNSARFSERIFSP